jgi:hypothetical protein
MKFDFAKILDISKRYWAIIVFCVVMLIAVIAIPVFVSGQQTALQKQLDLRKKTSDDIAQVLHKPRHQPVVSPDPDAAAPVLTEFPNERVIAAGENAIGGVQKQSMAMKDMSLQINVHKVLQPGSLPAPTDPFSFKRIYLAQFENEIPKLLQSATPPTEEEITLRRDQEAQKLTDQMPKNSATGEVYAKEVLAQNIAMMAASLPEKMRQDAATQHKMYMAPTALSIHPALAPAPGTANIAPDAESIWLAQMGLWIQQDVVGAIAKLNAASTNVASSPVKQLVQLYVPSDRSLYVMPGAAGQGGNAAATPAPAAGTAGASAAPTNSDTDPFPKDYTVSVTGRVTNGVFDVVEFYVVLNVQAGDVERVIQELERNRLLTVTQSEVQAVNSASMQLQGYYFGKTPIVTLTLRCEELYMRDWTHSLMPGTIKTFLNVDQQAAQGTTPTAAAN